MRELSNDELNVVCGGGDGPDNAWNSNDSLSATLVRNAGIGAIGGGPGEIPGAAAGAVVGLLVGFNEYYG